MCYPKLTFLRSKVAFWGPVLKLSVAKTQFLVTLVTSWSQFRALIPDVLFYSYRVLKWQNTGSDVLCCLLYWRSWTVCPTCDARQPVTEHKRFLISSCLYWAYKSQLVLWYTASVQYAGQTFIGNYIMHSFTLCWQYCRCSLCLYTVNTCWIGPLQDLVTWPTHH